MIDHRSMLV